MEENINKKNNIQANALNVGTEKAYLNIILIKMILLILYKQIQINSIKIKKIL